MPNRVFEEPPGLEGPDYVALVIEWDQLVDQFENELVDEPTERIVKPHRARTIAAAVAGAVGLIALASWGIHRLRAA